MPDKEVIQPDETPEAAEVEQPELESVPEAEPAEGEEAPEEQKRSKGGFQRRIDKLTREKYELLGRLKALEERPEAKTTAKVAPEDPEPTIDNWKGTYEAFVKELARWTARQEHKQLLEKQKSEQEVTSKQERMRETMETYTERVSDFVAEHDDFHDVVSKLKLPADIAPGVEVAIMEDENGPALAYHLATHPDLQRKLADCTQAQAVVLLGRISASLFPEDSEEEDTPPPPPKAKPAAKPIRPVRKPAPVATGLSDDLPVEEWLRRRNAQIDAHNRR